jgi:hypothetical protein
MDQGLDCLASTGNKLAISALKLRQFSMLRKCTDSRCEDLHVEARDPVKSSPPSPRYPTIQLVDQSQNIVDRRIAGQRSDTALASLCPLFCYISFSLLQPFTHSICDGAPYSLGPALHLRQDIPRE